MPQRTFAIALAALLFSNAAEPQADPPKPKKPTLNLRVSPRMAFSPVTVYLIAELAGGDDVEAYYCPEVEWSWGDGGKSIQEADCPPYEVGVSKIDRRFTADHEFRRAGIYTIAVTLRRVNKSLARSDVRITVRPGIGDPR